ncbi:hypothetical protein LCGC14_2742040 [marine sediment metagenome]|uniref:Uncharacterized protein n=1 Tax=marine sediment metagenome TaxID=412755 RepID=A0A0F9BVW8_9ZZZZ
MTCQWCHESSPVNRKDNFCSDMCQINQLQAELDNYKTNWDALAKDALAFENKAEQLQAKLKEMMGWAGAKNNACKQLQAELDNIKGLCDTYDETGRMFDETKRTPLAVRVMEIVSEVKAEIGILKMGFKPEKDGE